MQMTGSLPKTNPTNNSKTINLQKIREIINTNVFQASTIFAFTVIVRILIFYVAYWDENLRISSLKLDIVRHSYFVEQTFQGVFGSYVLPSGEIVNYSPVTPVIISFLVLIPKYVFSMSWYHSTMVAASLLMGIEAIASFLVMKKLGVNYFTSSLLIIFNPFELLDVMTWGGLSLILTMTCISWIFYVYIKITESKEKQEKILKWVIIGVLALISAFAHRTGFIIQILVFLTFFYKYRSYVIRFKLKKIHYLGISSIVLILTLLFIKIRKIDVTSLSKLYNLTPTIEITWETIPIAINIVATWVPKIYGYWIVLMSFLGLFLYGLYVPNYWEENNQLAEKQEPEWYVKAGLTNPVPNIIGYHLPRSYLIVTFLLFLYPWNPGGLRARFLASASLIYLYQTAFVQKFISNLVLSPKRKTMLLIIYYLGLIINSVLTLTGAIEKIHWVIQRYG